jgi:hypothetical protein
MSEDLQVTLSNKSAFISELRYFMLNRGPNPHRIGTSDWEPQAVINEEVYGLLTKLANNPGRDSVVRRFVSHLPAYPWDNFHWGDLVPLARENAA